MEVHKLKGHGITLRLFKAEAELLALLQGLLIRTTSVCFMHGENKLNNTGNKLIVQKGTLTEEWAFGGGSAPLAPPKIRP